MAERPPTDVRLDVQPGRPRPVPRPVEEPSFHIALLGDFSGRGGDAPTTGPLEAVRVDRDDLDTVLERFGPGVRIGAERDEGGQGGGLAVAFREIEDFHPDRLVERVPLFRSIREAASAGGKASAPRREARGGGGAGPAPVEEMLSGSVLDRVVEQSEGPEEGDADGGGRGGDPLRAWVDDLVRPHLEAPPDPEDARVADRVDALVAAAMREVLRDRAFQRLEALWRGVDFLVRRVETGPRLTIHLVDVTKEALAGPEAGTRFEDFLRRGAGHEGEPWSVVAATWSVGSDPGDLVALRELARRAWAAGTVLLAGGESTLAGLPSLADAGDRSAWGEPDALWAALRRETEAGAVGLVIPRFLLRLPYGEADPCERLELEEIPGTPAPEHYVWGAAALPVVLVLARAFARAKAELARAVDPTVGGLPLHLHRTDGEARATPCTEVALTRDDADRLMEAGLMPWTWSRGSDGIRLARLQSAAEPLAALAGWWRR